MMGGSITLIKRGVISFGEVIVDLVSQDQTNENYQSFLGGATVNVAVGVSRASVPSYYLCKFGTDDRSAFAEIKLNEEKVNLDYCIHSSNKKVCCVYVNLNEAGDRYFHAYINETPDEWLTKAELQEVSFQSVKIFYFGSGTLFHSTAKDTTNQALTFARKNNTIIAFDTNIRLKRWESEEQCRETILSYLDKVDIVKMAEEELLFLTETNTLDEGLIKVNAYSIPYLFITKGKDGALVVHNGKRITIAGLEVDAVDTTGAGDAFMAAILSCFHEKGIPVNDARLKEYLQIANQTGAQSTTKIGSL